MPNEDNKKTEYSEFMLLDQLTIYFQSLAPEEKSILKSKLSSRIPQFFDEKNQLKSDTDLDVKQFNYLATALLKISPDHQNIPNNGIAYKGKPSWITDNLLKELQNEALARRKQPLDRIDHFLGCGGKHADLLSVNQEILKFVSNHVRKRVKPTGIASYLYYDKPGLGIRPHVDSDVFSINMMLMLKHEYKQNFEPSVTRIFPANSEMESYQLSIGEVMIMHGGAVIHTRSTIKEFENVHLLTIGFSHEYPLVEI